MKCLKQIIYSAVQFGFMQPLTTLFGQKSIAMYVCMYVKGYTLYLLLVAKQFLTGQSFATKGLWPQQNPYSVLP